MKLPRTSINIKLFLPLVVLFVVSFLSFPRNAKFSYDYKKGTPWKYETLVAQFDFPVLKTDEQIMDEARETGNVSVPYYKFKQNVVDNSLEAVNDLNLGDYKSFKSDISASVEEILSKGVISDDDIKGPKSSNLSNELIYVQKGKRVSKKPASEVFRHSEALSKLLSEVSSRHTAENVDSILKASGAYSLIVPNLEYDARTTELVRAESSQQIATTQGFVSAGQLIVSEGEIVTSEIEQKLESYKKEFKNSLGYGGPSILLWLGNGLIAFMIAVLFFLVLYFLNKNLFKETNKYWYLIFIFLLTNLGMLIVNRFAPDFLYLVPFTLSALFLEAFFKNKIILPICCVNFLPLLIFATDGPVLYVIFLVASVVSIFMFKYFNRGWQQFITAIVVFVSILVVYFGFRLTDMVNGNPYKAVLFLFLGSMMSVAGYPLIFLFEKMFNLVSNSRLRDLCDTNNALLRELEHKAPGSFQHSLQVMNMVDAAARAIDANVLLVRAGALYHDIGKTKNPLCFVENESMAPGEHRYHEHLSPKESAVAIISHVSDGLELAAKFKLPQVIREFINTHHGTSYTGYFYNKYLNEGGNPSDTSAFYYKGEKPKTKEQILLMICDSLEAASRTLKDNSPETYSKFVESIVASKMDSGQFDEAEISIKELNTVKETLKGYLSQVYHERIVYPTKQNINNSK